MVRIISLTLTIFLVAFVVASGFAAPKLGILPGAKEAPRPAEPEVAYADPLGRSTPQGTVLGFMKSAAQGNYDQAVQYLDTKMVGIRAQKLVDALRAILERGFSGKLTTLSNKPEGNLDDNLPPSKDRVGTVDTSSGSLDILLERVERGNNPPIWLFSAETLKSVPEIYKELDVRNIEPYLPKFLVNTWLLWFPLWKWFFVLLLIPVLFGLSIVVTRLFTLMLLLFMRRIAKVRVDQHVVRLTGPLRILIFALAIWFVSLLSHSVVTSAFWGYVAATLTVVGATWLCVRIIDVTFKLKQSRLVVTSSDKISMVQLGRKLSKIVAVTVGAVVIFYIAGINIAAVLTGLGIGGIAIAFAAQKTLENLFGGIMIIWDQPIRVGDFCRAGEHMGTVENIGLRSTRIRTLDRTLVSVPNGQLAVMSLENFTRRDKIWFHHTLRLRYETTADQLRHILAEIRRMLYEHSKVETGSARIRFIAFGNSSLDLEVFAYVLETAYEAFLHVQEDLLLRIMDIIEGSGSGFALPSQTTYLAGDAGLDAAKSGKALEMVRQWREGGKLPFPDFSPETISDIENKTEYPPPDSALRNKKKE
ncbi:MAG TPA: mechanosensitive ion channel family protein [Thermodesulfobacteriota bacterium]|nr:mechanosensitive ion channel family protein [Thermodesulfobacteriota bacterium]